MEVFFSLSKDRQVQIQHIAEEIKELTPIEVGIIKSFVNTKVLEQNGSVKIYIDKIKHLFSEDQYKRLLIDVSVNIDQDKFMKVIIIQFVKQILPIVFKNNKFMADNCAGVITLEEAKNVAFTAASNAIYSSSASVASATSAAACYADGSYYIAFNADDVAASFAATAAVTVICSSDSEDKQKIIDTIVQICIDAVKNLYL